MPFLLVAAGDQEEIVETLKLQRDTVRRAIRGMNRHTFSHQNHESADKLSYKFLQPEF